MNRWFFCLLSGLLSQLVFAEYRVYSLRIGIYKSAPPYRSVMSTLAPRQYSEYYPVNPGEVIDYVDTWMCYERGGINVDLCKGPRDQKEILSQAPPIGEAFHPWDPFPYQPKKAAREKTRTAASDEEPAP